MIDEYGYRVNVGIVLAGDHGKVFFGKRIRQNAWQFPQGGLQDNESPEDAVYRELWEEVGLQRDQVELLAQTRHWLKYKIPQKLIRSTSKPLCIGQRQKWFLLKFIGVDADVKLDAAPKPEFDDWAWVNYWFPLSQVIHFKREVYRQALREFAPILWQTHSKGGVTRTLSKL